jgi:uncharacterized protein YkwD
VGPPGGLFMGWFSRRAGSRRSWLASAVTLVVVMGWSAVAVRDASAAGEDLALLVLANQARAAQNVPPLIWNQDLAEAALVHSEDLAAHGGNCDLHNSCNGEVWWKRVQRFYPGWVALGENVATSISNPQTLHDGWMSSPGHRANILNSSYTEFGAGIALGQTNFGRLAFATEDFGSRGMMSPGAFPALPAGSIHPLTGDGEPRDIQVTYYHANGGAPQAVRALVGSSCVSLGLQKGKAAYGTYGVSRAFSGSGCVPVVFEAIRADGTRHRFPKNDAILVGVGAAGAYCAERTTAVPTQDCGGPGTPPTPTPPPAPTPTPNQSQLGKLRISLKPGKANASKGVVQVQGTLPRIAVLDPTSGPVTVRLAFGQSGDWTEAIPELCGAKPCFTPNKRHTVFRGKHASASATFTQAKDGSWVMRFSARNETIGNLDSGTVRVTVTVDGRTFTGSAEAELKENGLFTD